jgi:putative inorganic carbon (hco3(-)) transporter
VSLTAAIWLCLFCGLSVGSLQRPVYGVSLYMMTFFAIPHGWWWGTPLNAITMRWSLIASLVLATSVIVNNRINVVRDQPVAKRVFTLLLLCAINATFVHFLLADNPVRSYNNLELMWKFLILSFLVYSSIQNADDLRVVLKTLIIGSLYIGYEVVINERGKVDSGRLEGIFIPGCGDSNYLAGILSMTVVLCGGLLLTGTKWEKLLSFIAAPFILDVILRCNSRGAFLALIAGACMLIYAAKGKLRKRALFGLALGCIALSLQLKDQDIINRFKSTFAEKEQRDASAESRVVMTTAGLRMFWDYPFGSGGEAAFKSDRGMKYIPWWTKGYKAVHNGYVDTLVAWGIQGFCLYMSAIWFASRALKRRINDCRKVDDTRAAFLGVIVQTALATQLVVSAFLSSLDGEWFYWLIALMLAYHRVVVPPALVQADNGDEQQEVAANATPELVA